MYSDIRQCFSWFIGVAQQALSRNDGLCFEGDFVHLVLQHDCSFCMPRYENMITNQEFQISTIRPSCIRSETVTHQCLCCSAFMPYHPLPPPSKTSSNPPHCLIRGLGSSIPSPEIPAPSPSTVSAGNSVGTMPKIDISMVEARE